MIHGHSKFKHWTQITLYSIHAFTFLTQKLGLILFSKIKKIKKAIDEPGRAHPWNPSRPSTPRSAARSIYRHREVPLGATSSPIDALCLLIAGSAYPSHHTITSHSWGQAATTGAEPLLATPSIVSCRWGRYSAHRVVVIHR